MAKSKIDRDIRGSRGEYRPSKQEREQVEATINRWRHYDQFKGNWFNQASEDLDFFMGNHWTTLEVNELQARGQAPLVVDRTWPAVEQILATLTANLPEFRVTGSEDGDVAMSAIFNDLIQHIMYVNDAKLHLSEWVKNSVVYGMGYLHVYWDPVHDDGDGEIVIKSIHPFDVYVDPNSREKDHSDADRIFISRLITKDRALVATPQKFHANIEKLTPDYDGPKYRTIYNNAEDIELLDSVRDEEKQYVRWIEEYFKQRFTYYRLTDTITGDRTERDLTADEFKAFKELPDTKLATETGAIDVQKIDKVRVVKRTVLGNMKLSEEVLETPRYPIIPLHYEWQYNPLSSGAVRRIRGMQREINKRRSLMIAHATTSTNSKLLYKKGLFDDPEKLEIEWSKPGFIGEVNQISNNPIQGDLYMPQPLPLPNGLYALEAEGKQDIEFTLGAHALSQGDPSQAPETFRATLAIEEFGNRRHALRTRDISFQLRRLGKVVIDYIQNHYKAPRIIRIVNPDRQAMEEIQTIAINMPIYDTHDPRRILRIENDVTIGKFDLLVVDGSMLPSNRWLQFDFYTKLFELGAIDQIELTKKIDIVDRKGLLERMSAYAKMQEQINALNESLERLQDEANRSRTRMLTAEENEDRIKAKQEMEEQKLKLKLETEKARLALRQLVVDRKKAANAGNGAR